MRTPQRRRRHRLCRHVLLAAGALLCALTFSWQSWYGEAAGAGAAPPMLQARRAMRKIKRSAEAVDVADLGVSGRAGRWPSFPREKRCFPANQEVLVPASPFARLPAVKRPPRADVVFVDCPHLGLAIRQFDRPVTDCASCRHAKVLPTASHCFSG